MSLITINTFDNNLISVGKCVVIDSATKKVREFDINLHNVNDIIGVSYPKINFTNRICSNIDGLPVIDKLEFYEVDENQTYKLDGNNNLIENANYDYNYNPATDDSLCYVAICGFAGVLKNQQIPSKWKMLKSGTTFDNYLIL